MLAVGYASAPWLSSITSRTGSAIAAPPMPLKNARRGSLNAMSLLLHAEAEAVARHEVDHQLVEGVLVALEVLPERGDGLVVLHRFAPPHREAIELGHDARLEVAARDELVGEARRSVEGAERRELAVAGDDARRLPVVG